MSEDMLDIARGGFGSAGAGNATHTPQYAVGTMKVSTAKAARKDKHRLDGITAKIKDPTREELLAAIEAEICWWCGATHGTTGKPIRGWAHHWSKAHGILAQHVRDILMVVKNTSFCDEEMTKVNRARMLTPERQAHARRASLISAEKRRGKPGTLTAGGRRSLQRSMRATSLRLHYDEPELMARAAEKRSATVRNKTPRRPCKVCGKPTKAPVTASVRSRRQTCSDECSRELLRRRRKVPNKDVPDIRRRAAAGETHEAIAAEFGCCRELISQIVRGKLRGSVR